jgi:hypothetical protein
MTIMSVEEKLFGPAVGVAIAGLAAHGAKLMDRDLFPLITYHVGDFSLVLTPIMFSSSIGRRIERAGEKYNSEFLRKVGEYFPEIVASGITLYFVLGESAYNIIPGNTRDPWDIPAVLLAAGSSYILAKHFQKKGL